MEIAQNTHTYACMHFSILQLLFFRLPSNVTIVYEGGGRRVGSCVPEILISNPTWLLT